MFAVAGGGIVVLLAKKPSPAILTLDEVALHPGVTVSAALTGDFGSAPYFSRSC